MSFQAFRMIACLSRAIIEESGGMTSKKKIKIVRKNDGFFVSY
jgi:hypothetical protein